MKRIFDRVIPVVIALALGVFIFTQFIQPKLNSAHGTSEKRTSNETTAFFASELVDSAQVLQPLKQYKGKTLIVNFWATWCPPCREEMPDLSELHEKLSTENVVVLGLAVDELEAV